MVGDKAIQVNVIPKRLKDGDSGDDALTTPLTVTGTPDELDREFAGQLVGFTGAFVKLGSNLSEIEAAHATAVKAVEAEKKKEIENKRKGSVSKPSSATAEAKPGPVVKDGKPVFGTKTAAETPSLFDSHAVGGFRRVAAGPDSFCAAADWEVAGRGCRTGMQIERRSKCRRSATARVWRVGRRKKEDVGCQNS